jgi:hypothetical protein
MSSSDSDSIAGIIAEFTTSSFYLELVPKTLSYGSCPRAAFKFSCFGYRIFVTASIRYGGWNKCGSVPNVAKGSSKSNMWVASTHPLSHATSLQTVSSDVYAGDYCDWEGVTCDSLTSAVIGIDLSSWGVDGVISSYFGLLTD